MGDVGRILRRAFESGDVKTAKSLISSENVNDIGGIHSESLLHIPCSGSTFLPPSTRKELMLLLIFNDADLSPTDRYGDTPLHKTAISDFDEQAEILLRYGGETIINEQNRISGETALHLAYRYKQAKMVRFLTNEGAKMDIPCNDNRMAIDYAVSKAEDNLKLIESMADETAKEVAEAEAELSTVPKSKLDEMREAVGSLRIAEISLINAIREIRVVKRETEKVRVAISNRATK